MGSSEFSIDIHLRGITWDQVNCKFTMARTLEGLADQSYLRKLFLSLGSINSRLVFDTQLDKANLLASKIFGFGPKKFPM